MQFLVKIYTSVSFTLEPNLPEFEDAFIDQCVKGIQEQNLIIFSRSV